MDTVVGYTRSGQRGLRHLRDVGRRPGAVGQRPRPPGQVGRINAVEGRIDAASGTNGFNGVYGTTSNTGNGVFGEVTNGANSANAVLGIHNGAGNCVFGLKPAAGARRHGGRLRPRQRRGRDLRHRDRRAGPRREGADAPPPLGHGRHPASGTHAKGELYTDSEGSLWSCVGAGTPGTWRKLAGPATAGALHILATPVRIYDSRPATSPSQGPKRARAAHAAVNSSHVPLGATAAMVNVLLVNAGAGNGNFTVWANDTTRPQANTLVWGGNAGRFATFAVTAVDAAAKVQVFASITTDLVLDVVGYLR